MLSCSSKKEAGYSHLLEEKDIKSRQVYNLSIKYQIFRENETDCKVYYQITPSDFLSMCDSSGRWAQEIGVELKVKANQLGSSVLMELNKDTIVSSEEIVRDSFSFSIPEKKDVIIDIDVFDRNKHVHQNYSSFWERNFDFIPEDFLIEQGNFISFGQAIIRKNEQINGELRLEIYQDIFSPAERMYSIAKINQAQDYKPKIEFTGSLNEIMQLVNELKVESYCQLYPLERSEKHANQKFHFTVQPSSINLSIASLAYLLDDRSEKNVSATGNDWTQFWFQASSNDAANAEKLIKEFNRRVKFANENFGSYKSGWQTDRGMLYILFGEPDRIQNDVRGENWIYGFAEINNKQFIFEKNPSGLNNNDYVLERGLYYREFWQSALLKWENGWITIDGY